MNRIAQRYRWSELTAKQRSDVLQRPAVQAGPETLAGVREILAEVRRDGDAALRALTRRLDGAELGELRVSETEFEAARNALTAVSSWKPSERPLPMCAAITRPSSPNRIA